MFFNPVLDGKLVEAMPNATDAAGRTGDWVSLKNYALCYVIVDVTQGVATTIAISINQATAVAGTASKVITNTVPIWSNLDTVASDTFVARTAAVNYTTDAGVKNKIVVFQIDPSSLDLANGFDCIAVVTGASSASNLTHATYMLVGPRYGGATPPSAIID
jgi:hypothetical protein